MAEHTDPFEQAAFERGMHVFVFRRGPEQPVPGIVIELVQRDNEAS